MSADTLTITRDGAVLVATMDDGRANAFSPDLIAQVDDALNTAEGDADVRAMVLAGRPERFSAGFDLSIIQSGDGRATAEMVGAGGALVRRLFGASVPVVAACTGHAVAAGALVLLGCDQRIGTDGPYKIGLNEVAIGMTLPDWALAIAETRLSKRHIQSSVVNAQLFDPSGAVDAGFLDRVVDGGELLETAVASATQLAGSLDPDAYANTVRVFRGATLDRMAETAPV